MEVTIANYIDNMYYCNYISWIITKFQVPNIFLKIHNYYLVYLNLRISSTSKPLLSSLFSSAGEPAFS